MIIIIIEPYPYHHLRTLPTTFPGVRFDLITRPVQDVSLKTFTQLSEHFSS